MTLELTQDVGRPPVNSEKNWSESVVIRERLLTGKTDAQQKTAADQKDLTDRGIIPQLELEDPEAGHSSTTNYFPTAQRAAQSAGNAEPGRRSIFDNLDADGNDNLSAKEWIESFDKIAGRDQKANENDFYKEFGRNEKTANFFEMANRNGGKSVSANEWLRQFDRLESDRDGDETIGRAEFPRLGKQKEDIFSKLDADRDQEIKAREWVDKFDRVAGADQKASQDDFFKAFGHNQHTENFFKAANANGNKDVTMSEWLSYYQKLEGSDKNFTISRREFNGEKGDGTDKGDNFVDKPDPSRYESQEHMEYIARLAAHEQQLNGSTQPNGPQGTIFLQTLLDAQAGGKLNGQSEIFLKGSTPEETEQRRRWFFQAMADSTNDKTGKIDGHVLSQSIVDTVFDASGMDISDSINKSKHLPAQTSAEALSVKGPGDPEDPDFIDNLSKSSGWSKQEIADDLLWGHAQIFSKDGKLNDESVRGFLEDALSGKDERTSGLLKSFPEIEAEGRRILASPYPADKLGELFLAAQSKQFGVPLDDQSYSRSANQKTGAENDMNFNPAEQSNSNASQKNHLFDRFLLDLKRAADTGNANFVNQTLNNFGDRFQSLANQILKTRSQGKDAEGKNEEGQKPRGCPFMALKDKFGGKTGA